MNSKGQVDLAMSCLSKAAFLRGILIGSRHQCVPSFFIERKDLRLTCYFRFEDMNRLITTAQLRPVVDKVFVFENAKEAYDYLESQAHVGKVVIKVARN